MSDRPGKSPMKRCRILLVDSHSLLLDVLDRFLAEIPEIDVVARARTDSRRWRWPSSTGPTWWS